MTAACEACGAAACECEERAWREAGDEEAALDAARFEEAARE